MSQSQCKLLIVSEEFELKRGKWLVYKYDRVGLFEVSPKGAYGCQWRKRSAALELTILSAKTLGRIIIMIRVKWQESLLDIIGVISKIRPRGVITISFESIIDSCDVGKCVDISDIGTEVEEVGSVVTRVSVKFLPTVGRVIERASN